MLDKIKLLLPGQIGYGMMIEQDAGYIEPKDNRKFVSEMHYRRTINFDCSFTKM